MPTITINFAADELETVQDVLSMLNGRDQLAQAKTVIADKEDARLTRAEEVAEKANSTETIEHKPAPADTPTEEKPKKTRTRKNPNQQEVTEAVKTAKADHGEQFCFDCAEAAGATVEDTLRKTIREMDKTLYKGFISTLSEGPEVLAERAAQVQSEAPAAGDVIAAAVTATGSLFEENDNNVDTPIEDNTDENDTEELADDDDWATDDEPEAEAEKVQIDPAGVQQALRAYAKQDRAAAREVLKASGAKTIGDVLELPQDKLLEIMKVVS